MPDTLPPLPDIDSIDWTPPLMTNPVELGRSSGPLIIFADSDNSGYQDWVSDVPRESGDPRLNNWWDGAAPPERQYVMRKYWKLVPGTFTHLTPGTSFRKSWEYVHGVSTTDSQSITAQFGIAAEGLSAGISATFSHSVTISDQVSSTTEYSVDAPASGTRVWSLWDLTYDFLIVRAGTSNPIQTGTYRGDVDFSGDDHYSGAYLTYRWTNMTVSAGFLCPHDRVFP